MRLGCTLLLSTLAACSSVLGEPSKQRQQPSSSEGAPSSQPQEPVSWEELDSLSGPEQRSFLQDRLWEPGVEAWFGKNLTPILPLSLVLGVVAFWVALSKKSSSSVAPSSSSGAGEQAPTDSPENTTTE